MDANIIKAKLIEVLQTVQSLSGEDCPAIEGGTKPVEALPKFRSKVWPVAAGMLGIALGKSIPCEGNIFVDDDTTAPRALHHTVAPVLQIQSAQETDEGAQVGWEGKIPLGRITGPSRSGLTQHETKRASQQRRG